jgi:hypothetical protein
VERILEPEWLDELPPGDPKAVRSRRDLQRLNRWMGHPSLMANTLVQYAKKNPIHRLVDLGGGDGMFALGLVQELVKFQPRLKLALVDRQNHVRPETRDQFSALGCGVEIITADVFDWLARWTGGPPGTVFIANLFLHHFHEAELCEIFWLASGQADFFVACEPRRTITALAAAKMCGLIGCNSVTRHDAVVSVRAGFADRELSELWPAQGNWALTEQVSGWFSHLFLALRK